MVSGDEGESAADAGIDWKMSASIELFLRSPDNLMLWVAMVLPPSALGHISAWGHRLKYSTSVAYLADAYLEDYDVLHHFICLFLSLPVSVYRSVSVSLALSLSFPPYLLFLSFILSSRSSVSRVPPLNLLWHPRVGLCHRLEIGS